MADTIKVLEVNVDDQGNGGVFSLIKSVIENKPDDVQIDIAALEPFDKKENIRHLKRFGTRIFFTGYKGNKLKKQAYIFKKMRQLLKQEKYDVVHIHADVANKMLVSGLAAKTCGVPKIILHSHSTGVDTKNSKAKEKIHFACRKMLSKLNPIYAACSYSAAEWMFPGIDKDRIHIIKNGIDLCKFRFNEDVRKDIRNSLNIDDNTFLIGHVGRFMYTKNHEFMIKAFKKLKDKWKEDNLEGNVKLLFVGGGELEPEMRQKAKKLGLKDDIIFYGISNKVNELLMGMDAFILPSHFEGFPVSGVEAQASGLPVVFSNKIANEIALTKQACFLPIDDDNISKWVDCLMCFRETKRGDNIDIMLDKGYDIKQMVIALLRLYRK